METTKDAKVEPVDMKLEIVVLGVSDVDISFSLSRCMFALCPEGNQ